MAIETVYLKDLLRTGQTDVVLSEAYAYDDLPVVGVASTDLRLSVNNTGMTAKGRYEATVEEPCDRCFEPYQRILSGRIDERFVYESLTDPSGGERELQPEDFYDVIGDDGVVDIKDLIRQYIVLGLSTDRVCNSDGCNLPEGGHLPAEG